MQEFFSELNKLSPGTLSAFAALAGAVGGIISAVLSGIVSKFIVTPFLGARDRQDREVEWRKLAMELTKLDLDRKIKTRPVSNTNPLRPSILDFLANYRDIQELGEMSVKELYLKIEKDRISRPHETNRSIEPDVKEW